LEKEKRIGDGAVFGLSIDPKFQKFPSASPYSAMANNPINIVDYDGREGRKVVLTFDDGIDVKRTPTVLDILREAHVSATFFINSALTSEQKAIYERMLAEGHIVASHTSQHTPKTRQSLDVTAREIRALDHLVKDDRNNGGYYLRFPYGSADQRLVDLANKEGYIVVYWDVDALDWCYGGDGICKRSEVGEQDQNNMLNHILRQVGVRDGGVILLHDVQQITVNGLKEIIYRLKNDGYIFTNINDPSVDILAGPGVRNEQDLLLFRQEYPNPTSEESGSDIVVSE
jgi:peptidoglycan/xylan/chitin deacetylase (PgdA/CDA1 family)